MSSMGRRAAVLAAMVLLQVCVAQQVHVLTSKNFKQLVLDSSDYWLVEFYAPWCGHCKKLEPEWKDAAKKLKAKAKLGAVDCTVHQDLGQKYGIQGYPTIKEFGKNKKKPKDYNGGRQARDIVGYVQSNPDAGLFEQVDMLTYATAHTFFEPQKRPKVVLLGRNRNKKGKPRWLEEVAQQFRSKVSFGFVPGSDDKIATHLGIREDRPLVLVAIGPEYVWTKLSQVDTIKDDVVAFVKQSLKGTFDEPKVLPAFPPPQNSAPKKKPPIGAIQQIHASTLESLCLKGASKMCVVFLPTSLAFDLKPTAKKFRRDPLSFFYVHPDDLGFHSQLTQWLNLPPTSTNRCLVFKTGKQVRVTDLAKVEGTAALDNLLVQVLDGLHPSRAVVTAPFEPPTTHSDEL
ncbi:protein disulfide-isomerase domain, variant 1 [Aphanomyces invadans]|uniref:protein disulfide-isomerase n=1 Tax=Aphanomyces invadans TaxID=157072 RepID=A0A024TIY4_9STRA|nr:protein disulfide-isomerase domain, variant 1 [Aphanomyces invadans]ETV94013.1 protein disulfide-isomerase domain, variant 1 [Aphanomyces invadans]|eukprot:XP_008877215.1 protein disulfide-isomerase domain, variant 1 [Aphanomyces invadans]